MQNIIKNLAQHQDLFQKNNINYLALFGSTARGENINESDVDLLFDYQEPPSLFQLADLKEKLEKLIQRPVDLVSRRAVNKHLKPYIIKDLKLIYEKR